MMPFDLQTLAALVCVAAAIFVLVRRMLRWQNGQAIGGGCSGCSSGCGDTSRKNNSSLKVPLPVIELPENMTNRIR